MRILLLILFLFSVNTLISQDFQLDTQVYVEGFAQPIGIENAGDDRLFIIEKTGRIAIIDANDNLLTTRFLDIRSLTSANGERGLLGLAFHPNYSTNGFFYVNYTDVAGDTVISRFSVNPNDPNDALEDSEVQLLTYEQDFANHNGGDVTFGSDGMLYIASGDGGSGNDPNGNSQNLNSLLGKILRLDVDIAAPYIPSDNPFVNDGDPNTRGEIWAYGLRNPFRFSFDSVNNDFWIADVGQSAFEEINKVSGNPAGLNYGWKCFEGFSTTNAGGNANCLNDTAPHTPPIVDYDQSNGRCSVTGGRVYRGTEFPNLVGIYIFADFCKNELGAVDSSNDITFRDTSNSSGSFAGFGVDNNNVLYVASINGAIYKVVDNTALSQNDNQDNIEFTLFPNPATNEFSIISGSDKGFISIHTIQGKRVFTSTAEDSSTIDISALQEGFYLVTFDNDKGEKQTQSLIISR